MIARLEEILDNRWLIFVWRVILGGIFVAASVTKLQQQAEFIDTVIGYGILPDVLARLYGLVVPWVELFIGCCLILGIFSRFAAALSIPLTISFVIASSYALLNAVSSSCGCFGEVISLSHPVSLSLDAVMLAMALLLLFRKASEKFLSVGPWLSRYNLGSGRRGRLIFEKVSKLAVVAMAMVAVFLIILGAQHLFGTESESSLESYVTPTQSPLDREIESALAQGKPTFIYFYAEGCPACEAVKPIINELEQEYGDRIAFMHVDYWEASQAVEEFGIEKTPTMLLITGKNDEGEYVVYRRFEGVIKKETIIDSLESL